MHLIFNCDGFIMSPEGGKRDGRGKRNRYGIELAGDLYLPENYAAQKNPAIIVAGPFGAVKEQASGLYAQQMAAYGFAALAFDPSFGGESGGSVRNTASPDIFTEDYSAAVDYIGLLDFVDRNRIGVIGICGLSGMAITAAGTDTRIKAVATMSMYDMSRDMNRGHMDYYTEEQRNKIKEYLSNQRWKDAENGAFALGNHEIGFDETGKPLTGAMEVPAELPEEADPAFASFYNYSNIKEVSPRPILMVVGENAHSRYYSEDAYKAASEPKELLIIPEADHVSLYDDMEKIPFDKPNQFFKENLK